jgi:AAA family ATPase
MANTQKFTIRPLSKPGRSDLRDTFKIYLSPTALLSAKLRSGDVCSISKDDSSWRTAIAWSATEKIQDTVVQTSKLIQDLYGFKLGEKVSIAKLDEPIPEVDVVILDEVPKAREEHQSEQRISGSDRGHWEWYLEHTLSTAQYICAGMQFESIELKGKRRSFVVKAISSQTRSPSQDPFQFSEGSRVRLQDENSTPPTKPLESFDLDKMMAGVGGLKKQIEQIQDQLQDFKSSGPELMMPSYYHGNSGIILYGPKGTGKSLVLKKLSNGPWQRVFNITSIVLTSSPGNGEKEIRDIFATARRFQPSIIIIDQLEFIAPKRKFSDSLSSPTLAPALCEALDSLGSAQVFVISTTRHPNEVDESLRTPNRFGLEVEFPVPSAVARKEILQAIRGSSDEPNDILIDSIAEKTHGFVGADIFALLQVACRKGRSRYTRTRLDPIPNGDLPDSNYPTQPLPFNLTEQDIAEALTEIRPTAMREVFLETPKVLWSDIGGLHSIKLRLQKAISRPLKVKLLPLSPSAHSFNILPSKTCTNQPHPAR